MTVPSAALKGQRLVLGVTGSISCYKAIEVASQLTQLGVQVDAVLTESALRFVQPLAFQAVTGRTAYGPDALWGQDAHILHTRLAWEADALAIVPATAHVMAQLAGGQAGGLLLVTALAAECPLLLAPAMDGGMWDHPATQANVKVLRERGGHLIGPKAGRLASGSVGMGRLAEPDEIVTRLRAVLGRGNALAGVSIVITAGGTREPMDPVRHLANRSSGKQGLALAQAAQDRGAEVTLITAAPCGDHAAQRVVRVNTAREMQEAVNRAWQQAQVLVMAAAVADFRPAAPAAHKLKKDGGLGEISLAPNPDILAELPSMPSRPDRRRLKVGFAAETRDLRSNARGKLRRKGLDMIIVNDVGQGGIGFASDFNAADILDAQGGVASLPRQTKFALSEAIMDRIAEMLRTKES